VLKLPASCENFVALKLKKHGETPGYPCMQEVKAVTAHATNHDVLRCLRGKQSSACGYVAFLTCDQQLTGA
jgi:hypothetical protein